MSAQPVVTFLSGPTLGAPVGSTRSLTLRFDNQPDGGAGGDVGYSPYVDLRMPTLGADGAGAATDDGLTFLGATYLGVALERTVLTFDASGNAVHPFAKDASGNAVVVTGNPGETLVVLRLPFGSFTPDQTPSDIVLTVGVSELADLNVPLNIQATGGFAFGRDALNNPTIDAPVRGATATLAVEPKVIELLTFYVGPEQETATGPSYPRTWVAQADIAAGQSVGNVVLTQRIPDGAVITGTSIANGTGSITVVDGVVTATFTGSYAGGAPKPTLNVDFYVTEEFAAGGEVLDPASGAFRPLAMNARLEADWQPVDPRDALVHFDIDPAGAENTITAKSIAVQKSVAVVDSLKAGGHLQWTLDGQVSNYFDVDHLVLTDTLGDGQRFDTTFGPTLVVEEGGATILSAPITQYTVVRDPVTGLTTVTFDVSATLRAAGLDDALNGGTAENPHKATAKVVFRSVIEEDWVGPTPGDDRVDQGDPIGNGIEFSGQVAETDAPIKDGSGAGVTLPVSTVSKGIHLINGVAAVPGANGKINVVSGDEITYRLTLDLPLTGAHEVRLKDYLPLPVLLAGDADANSGTAASMTFTAGTPGAGQFTFGAGDTYHLLAGAAVPTVAINAASNSLTFDFGSVVDPNYGAGRIEILFTVTVVDAPFGDGLLLTNQVTSTETNSFNAVSESNAIVQFVLGEPRLDIHKAVVATSNAATTLQGTDGPATFNAPGTAGARFSGSVTSAGIDADPFNDVLRGVDAGDLVTFAVVVENTGSGYRGAYDVVLRDVLPAGFTVPAGAGLNLRVTDGNGNALAYTNIGGGFFDPAGGIQLTDPSAAQGALTAYSATSGTNIVVISYDLLVQDTAPMVDARIPNTATVVNFAGEDGGVNRAHILTTDERVATTAVVTATPEIAKTVVATDQAHTTKAAGNAGLDDLAIGETVTYEITVRVPEGRTHDLRVEDLLPVASSGTVLEFISAEVLRIGGNLSGGAGLALGATGTVTNRDGDAAGLKDTVRFDFGDVTNVSDNARTDGDTVVIRVVARAADVSANAAGDVAVNTARTSALDGDQPGVRWSGEATARVEIVEPRLLLTKTVTQLVDGGDTVTYTVTLTNETGAFSAAAFDLNILDTLSALAPDAVLIPGTVVKTGTGAANATILDGNDAGDTRVEAGITRLDPGQSVTLTFQVKVSDTIQTGKTVVNTAVATGDGLPGQDAVDRNYSKTADASFTVAKPKVTKSVVETSDADTGSVRLNTGRPDLKIGEVVTYEIRVVIAEGDSANLRVVDILPDVLTAATSSGQLVYINGSAQVVSVGANLSSLSGGSLLAPTVTTSNAGGSAAHETVTFNFGDVRNTPTGVVNAGDEIVLRIKAQVTDVGSNLNGDVLTNTAYAQSGNVKSDNATASVDLVEPVLLLDKSSAFTPGAVRDAGAEVTYTVVIRHASNSNLNAYDLAIRDLVPADLQIVAGSLTSSAGTASFNGQQLSLDLPQLDLGQQVTVTYKAVLKDAVTPGEALVNTARVDYDNREGAGGRAASAQDTETVTVALNPSLMKAVVDTSLAGTGTAFGNATRPDLAIGETVTYRLIATVGEGTQRLLVTDNLPTGLQILSAEVESIGAKISGGLLTVGAGATSITGQLVTFDFGTVVNAADNAVDAGDRVSVLVTARVVDGAATANGAVLTNAGRVETSAPGNGAGAASATANAAVDVVRPFLLLDKATPFEGGDAGDVVTYTLIISHHGSSRAPAYDATIADLLPADLVLIPASVTSSSGTVSVSGNGLTVALPEGYAPGTGAITVTYQAKLADSVSNAQVVPNSAQLTYSTAPAGTPGRATTTVSDAVSVPVFIVDALDKQIVGTSYAATTGANVAVGEEVTYRLVATLGEGTQKLVLSDALPNGMQYLSSKVVSVGGVTGSSLGVGAAGTFDAGAGRVSFDFGTITNAGDNVRNAGDEVIVEVVAKVATAAVGMNLVNTGRLEARTPGGTAMPTRTDTETVTTVALPRASLGDRVFDDANGNGVQDGGEVGLANVLVRLLNADGTPTGQTTTNGTGGYLFSNLLPGTYKVEFVTPAGYTFSPADQGGDEAKDSNANAAGRTADVVLDPGENDLTVDAGMVRLGSIAGRVFEDADADGQRETGDGPVGTVTVRLLDGAGNPTGRTTTTAADGTYKFDGLVTGTYRVEFVRPDGTAFTPADQGADTTDSDADVVTGRTPSVTLASGGVSRDNDAGIYVPVSLSGRAFTDMDADGQRETGDGPVNGVTVRLLDGAGTPTGRTTTTAPDGTYRFDGLVPGSYSVEFVKPNGTVFTPNDRGSDATDSDADPATGRTPTVTLLSSGTSENNDAGLYVPAQLHGRVWLDWDRDGRRDTDEAAVTGVTVRLLNADGTPTGLTTATAADGTYKFTGLVPAAYVVEFVRPDGTVFTLKDVGPDTTDSDAAPGNGRTGQIVLVSGQVSRNNDAGLQNVGDQGPCVEAPANVLTPGNDQNNPTSADEAIAGIGGNDALQGGFGNDTLHGGEGNDTLLGGEGDDSITGSVGNDLMHGNGGHDVMCLGDGDDDAEGGDGDDVISGGGGNDHYQGERGDDVLFGDAGDDFVEANEGDDFLSGGVGNDFLVAHNEMDILVAGADRGTASLVNGRIQATYGDLIQSQSGGDRFVYRPGDGVDLLQDFDPRDGDTITVYGYSGVVATEIVNGYRVVYFGPDAAVMLPGHYQVAPDGTLPGFTFAPDLAAPTTFDQASTLVLLKDATPFYYGAQGDDAAYGTAAGDVMRGNGGNDWLMGRDGNDTLDGGAGADWLMGGNGTDTVTYEGAAAGVAVSLAARPINGTAGDARGDVLIAVENLVGSRFADTMSGDGGANVLDGGANHDVLEGGAGNDTILGGAGKDTMTGGLGADVLTGGADADRFRWTATAESAPGAGDTVTDFSRAGGDKLDLSAIDPKPAVAGDQAFAFIGTAALAANGTSQVHYVAQGMDTRVEADADGDGVADFAVLLKGSYALVASDFVL